MIGRFVISKAGHDENKIYVVLKMEKNSYYVTDGEFHPIEKTKKKNRKHIQLMNAYVKEELLERLKNNQMVYDHEIKYAIRQLKGE